MTLVARDLMKTPVVTTSPDMTLVELERCLLRHRIGGAPVVSGGKLVGMVSRSDIVRVLSLEQSMAEVQHSAFARQAQDSQRRGIDEVGEQVGQRMQKLQVRHAMTDVRAKVAPDVPVREVAQLMAKHLIHRVLVTDADALLGVVSRIDLVRLIADGRFEEV
jgi:CBS domain-containing protein